MKKWQREINEDIKKLSLSEMKSNFQQAERIMNGDFPTEYCGYRYAMLKKKLKEVQCQK